MFCRGLDLKHGSEFVRTGPLREGWTAEPPLKAIISDIHGNLEGLQAVLADIRDQGISTIYCLGDVVGYGPNPRECVDLVMETCQVCLLGNHDQGAMFDPEGFNAPAERAIFWTRAQLETGDPQKNERRWEFLGERPRFHREGQFLFVHGSARNPLNEYVFPDDVFHQKKMEKIFALVEHCCFQGHTHVPGVFTSSLNFYAPIEINHSYEIGDEKILVNVGSVGQPRDGDPRACYVLLDEGGPGRRPRITYRRVEYDRETTIRKIYDNPELDDFLGDRLRNGQ